MLVPSKAIVQMPIKQLTLGKSGYEFFHPGVVSPVASLGALLPLLLWPLAMKYGEAPPGLTQVIDSCSFFCT